MKRSLVGFGKEIAEEHGVKYDTLRKAIYDVRLKDKERLESTTFSYGFIII